MGLSLILSTPTSFYSRLEEWTFYPPGVQVLFHWQVIEMESTSDLSSAMNFRADPQTYLAWTTLYYLMSNDTEKLIKGHFNINISSREVCHVVFWQCGSIVGGRVVPGWHWVPMKRSQITSLRNIVFTNYPNLCGYMRLFAYACPSSRPTSLKTLGCPGAPPVMTA